MFDANAAITRREILDLMEAARWAPNHKLTQP
jgi:nitroreductase